MGNKINLEKYILENINSGKWQVNHKLPPENKLIELTGFSKMSIRKTIDRMKYNEILYSVQGGGVFVNTFHNVVKYSSLENKLGITKVTYLPSRISIPNVILEEVMQTRIFQEKEPIQFTKLYLKGEEVIAFTINWIDHNDHNLKVIDFISGNKRIYDSLSFEKVINISKMTKGSIMDNNIFQEAHKWLPTIYSHYLTKNQNITMLRITKVKPKYFVSYEFQTREK